MDEVISTPAADRRSDDQSTAEFNPRKATLWLIVSLLWVFPSAGGVWLLFAEEREWLQQTSFGAAVAAVRLEQWIGLGLLALHTLFLGLAIYHARRDRCTLPLAEGRERTKPMELSKE